MAHQVKDQSPVCPSVDPSFLWSIIFGSAPPPPYGSLLRILRIMSPGRQILTWAPGPINTQHSRPKEGAQDARYWNKIWTLLSRGKGGWGGGCRVDLYGNMSLVAGKFTWRCSAPSHRWGSVDRSKPGLQGIWESPTALQEKGTHHVSQNRGQHWDQHGCSSLQPYCAPEPACRSVLSIPHRSVPWLPPNSCRGNVLSPLTLTKGNKTKNLASRKWRHLAVTQLRGDTGEGQPRSWYPLCCILSGWPADRGSTAACPSQALCCLRTRGLGLGGEKPWGLVQGACWLSEDHLGIWELQT